MKRNAEALYPCAGSTRWLAVGFRQVVHRGGSGRRELTLTDFSGVPLIKILKNARLTPLRREEMGQSVIALCLNKAAVARVYSNCAKIVARWVGRYRREGRQGILVCSWRPH